MNLIELCTRRPVAITMVTLAVLLFGLVAQSRLEVTLLPDLSYPTLTVRVELPGAAPEEIETLLSKPIEEAVGVIRNLRRVSSISQAERADVRLEFNWGTAMDFAVLDVREKLDALELPREARRPVVLRFDPSEDPILRYGLALTGVRANADEAALKRLRRIAEDSLQKPLEGVDGVAAVRISGGLEDEVQVLVDLGRLSQFGLTLERVTERLSAENANLAGGRVEQGAASYLVRTLNQFRSLDEMRDTILLPRGGGAPGGATNAAPVYLRDVAEVRAGFKEREAIIRIQGAEAVEIALYKEGDGNTVSVADRAQARIETLRKRLPPDMRLESLYDQSRFIRQAIAEVRSAALEGALLAVLVLYLFLRRAWTTVIVAIAIPVSVIAAFNLMYAWGLSLNIMSLGGIALAVGMLVDDAIVVLENIYTRHEQGLPLAQAAVIGTREVAGAVTASTLTTVAVFFPMVFVQGIAGQLFADQALVVSATLMFSLLVSLTLIPMLAARAGRARPIVQAAPLVTEGSALRQWRSRLRMASLETLPSALLWPLVQAARGLGLLLGLLLRPLAAIWSRGFSRLESVYLRALDRALDHPALVLVAAAALFGLALALLPRIGVELLPPFNQGEFRAELRLPPGTPLERTDAVLRELSTSLADEALAASGLQSQYTVAGTGNRLDADTETGGENVGNLNLVLRPGALAAETGLMAALSERIAAIPGAVYRYVRPTLFTLETPLEIEFSGYDLDTLARASERLRERLSADPRYTELRSTLMPGYPEIQVRFDTERAARLGLDTAVLADRVGRAVQGSIATRYRIGDREIDVLVRGQESVRDSLDAVSNLVINPEASEPLRLSAVATVTLRNGPSEIRRIDQVRHITLSANRVDRDLGTAQRELQAQIETLVLPAGVSVALAGQSEEMQRSFRSLQFALALAVFLIYLVMASQFESLVHPFVILFTIPLAAIGAILSLFLTGSVINVVALIGMIVLAGIVVKNGIVLIDLVNRLREEGLVVREALLRAGRSRLRPILMTTLTTLLGLMPMAIAGTEGAELRRPLAITVIGGLSVSTLLTLIVIPVMYSLVSRNPEKGETRPADEPGSPILPSPSRSPP